MRLRNIALPALAGLLLSCSGETPTSPAIRPSPFAPEFASFGHPSQVVISQVYGGGGNTGAQYNRKFVELFNRGGTTASLAGWSIQYASATGTGNFAGNGIALLSGSIAPGQYVLVQLTLTGSTGAALPAPDIVVGTAINIAAGSGKLILANTTAGLTCNGSTLQACSTDQLAQIVDLVGYGTANFYEGAASAPALSNTLAAFRKDGGCQDTQKNDDDFTTAAPAPRNRASTVHDVCPVPPLGPLDHVTVTGPATVFVGGTAQLAAAAEDANYQTVPTASVTWTSSDETVATVSAAGVVTGVAASSTPVTITASATDNGITKAGSMQVSVNTPTIGWLDISSSSSSFPPGFQTQLFATARTAQNGTIIPATFTFEAVDPQYATIQAVQNTGIVTGVAAADTITRPGFRVTATPTGGGTPYSFITRSITIETPVSAPVTIYGTNDELGDPTPASASDPNDFLIRRAQYVISYNQSRGTPNWVSYELDARQMGGQDRCNCFSADPLLPAERQITTADYTGGGFDRGHMTRSFDRTAANVDNATTFYLTNIVPQMADLNQGPWSQFEMALGDSADAGRAVYVITGPLYSRSHGLTFLKNAGKVAIPDSTWKIALIGPRDAGNPFTRANVQTWSDLAGLTILAVNMPNVAGIKNDAWTRYLTTARQIEQATGYDFLSVLSQVYEDALEANDHAPTARLAVSGTADEGSVLTFDASAASDPDIGRTDLGRTEGLTYAWQFSDGATASGPVATHTFATFGAYTATLHVTDAFGWPATLSQPVAIANVPPAVAAFAGATLLQGETYAAAGGFTDPGAETWTASVDYGDGSGVQPLALSGKSFALTHVYGAAGTFAVTVSVSDGDRSGSANATVRVLTPAEGIAQLAAFVNGLGGLGNGERNSLRAKLNAAAAQVAGGHAEPAVGVLGAFVNEIDAMVNSRRLGSDAADPILTYAERVIASLRTGGLIARS